jgi:hypothetical protein
MALVTGHNVRHYPARTIIRVSKRTYCLSDFIITPFAVSKLLDLLRKFFSSLYF